MLLTTSLLFIEQPKTLIFIVLILVLFFGAKRIPELMRGLGQGVREFKDATTDPNKAPQTHQPYQPQQSYGQPNGQAYPPQQPYAAQPGQPAYPPQPQQYPAQPYPQGQPTPPAPTVYDANGQPLS